MVVNNAFYETAGRTWWADDASFAYTSLRFCVNPVRYGYFSRTLRSQAKTSGRVLDVGCGGGYLSEAFARDGFEVQNARSPRRRVAGTQNDGRALRTEDAR